MEQQHVPPEAHTDLQKILTLAVVPATLTSHHGARLQRLQEIQIRVQDRRIHLHEILIHRRETPTPDRLIHHPVVQALDRVQGHLIHHPEAPEALQVVVHQAVAAHPVAAVEEHEAINFRKSVYV